MFEVWSNRVPSFEAPGTSRRGTSIPPASTNVGKDRGPQRFSCFPRSRSRGPISGAHPRFESGTHGSNRGRRPVPVDRERGRPWGVHHHLRRRKRRTPLACSRDGSWSWRGPPLISPGRPRRPTNDGYGARARLGRRSPRVFLSTSRDDGAPPARGRFNSEARATRGRRFSNASGMDAADVRGILSRKMRSTESCGTGVSALIHATRDVETSASFDGMSRRRSGGSQACSGRCCFPRRT